MENLGKQVKKIIVDKDVKQIDVSKQVYKNYDERVLNNLLLKRRLP